MNVNDDNDGDNDDDDDGDNDDDEIKYNNLQSYLCMLKMLIQGNKFVIILVMLNYTVLTYCNCLLS